MGANISKGLKITWKVLEKIILVAIIFVCCIIAIQRISNNDKAFLGYRIFRVQTGSMIPKYDIGDVILVKETPIDEIQIGDDVTYWGTTGTMQGKIVTHQVIQIEEIEGQKVFHTKGIANYTEDPVIYVDQINGVVKSEIHILSAITKLLANPYVFYFCAIIPLTIFVFFAFVKTSNKKFDKAKYEENIDEEDIDEEDIDEENIEDENSEERD